MSELDQSFLQPDYSTGGPFVGAAVSSSGLEAGTCHRSQGFQGSSWVLGVSFLGYPVSCGCSGKQVPQKKDAQLFGSFGLVPSYHLVKAERGPNRTRPKRT